MQIHISRVPEFEVTDVKEIARKIVHFQPTIDQHFPAQDRVNNDFCRSNAGDQQEIQNAQNLNQLIEIMSPSRRFAWNLQALKQHGTIEYRQAPGQMTPRGANSWVRFAISFIHAVSMGYFNISNNQRQPQRG